MLPLSVILIPVEVISFEEAVKLGLAKPVEMGVGVSGIGCVAEGNHGEPGKIVERFQVENGETHLLFMDGERAKKLKEKGDYEDYLDHFKTILGVKKETFFKNNNLKLKEKI